MRKEIFKFIVLLAVALGAGPAAGAMWQWSTTASTNATADPTINWAEGQSPSSVNDSARAMMAVLASWRNDLGAVTATTGTSTAYALTSNQGGFVANAAHDGFIIGFIPNVTNAAGGVTINVDTSSAKPLRAVTTVAIPSGAMVVGSKYLAAYKFSTDEWLLINNFPSQFEVPLGAMIPFTGDTAPNANFIIPAGQCISRTTYATYFSLVSTRFGACDGVTTFAAPDMRGRGMFSEDDLGGSAANRITSTWCGGSAFNVVGAVCGFQNHTLTALQTPILTGVTASIGATNFLIAGASTEGSGGTSPSSQDSGTNVLSVTVNGTGGAAHPILNPMMAVNLLLRVL